jgi:hypothetical protein
MAGAAAPARLPAVHPFPAAGVLVGDENSATGFKEVFFLGEELVVGEKGRAAEPAGCKIDEAGGREAVESVALTSRPEIPKSKSQIPRKSQIPKSKRVFCFSQGLGF